MTRAAYCRECKEVMYWITAGPGADYALLPLKGTGRMGPKIPVHPWENKASGTAGEKTAPTAGGSMTPGTSGSTAPGKAGSTEGECLSPAASEAPDDDDLGDWGIVSTVSECGSFVMVDPESDKEQDKA
jgi:hypothetical protein